MNIQGIIFDMDGTLIEPAIDFRAMREAVGILQGDILHILQTWEDAPRQEAMQIIADFEAQAAENMRFQPGYVELMQWLENHRLPRAIITRNNQITIDKMLQKHPVTFDPMIDRTFLPPKPSPASILHILETWNLAPQHVLMVGDTKHDLEAAEAASAPFCLVSQPYNEHLIQRATFCVTRLDELCSLLRPGQG